MAIFDKEKITELYRKRAGCYNITANLYYLAGFREMAYRRKAVRALDLRDGNSVVEIGCGTGFNFPLLQKAWGRKGRSSASISRKQCSNRRNGVCEKTAG